MPTKRSGRAEDFARPEIGSVEVFEPKIAASPTAASTFAITSALTVGSSKTASITRSQPASAA